MRGHSAKHYPYIGYGHKLLPHENLTADITEEQADSLLRANLLERYKYFRQYGKDALLLTLLAYNVGHSCLLGYRNARRVTLSRKSSPATGISTRSISHIAATKVSQSQHRTPKKKRVSIAV